LGSLGISQSPCVYLGLKSQDFSNTKMFTSWMRSRCKLQKKHLDILTTIKNLIVRILEGRGLFGLIKVHRTLTAVKNPTLEDSWGWENHLEIDS